MAIKNFSPYKLVKKALSGLKPNEQRVVAGRFGIDEGRKTLSAIGNELKLSRERIRQIEKDGLKKLSIALIERDESGVIPEIVASFDLAGGISIHEKISEKFLEEAFHENKNEFNSLNLLFFLIPELSKIEKTRELEESWTLASISKEEITSIIDRWVDHLKNKKKPEHIDVLVKANPEHSKYKLTFLSELPSISKKLVKTESNHVGLSSWPEVNPKNVRDKIYYVLKKEGKPLHFNSIAQKINEQKFTKRNVVKATVHNELIADNRFILIGRGIYALSEWGFKPGTVCDVLKNVLMKNPGAMSIEDIVSEVLKQRTVKKNTILINLQTKKEFERVGKEKFRLKIS